MTCCSVNGLDKMFNESRAKKEIKAYQKKGLDKRARKLADFLKSQDVGGATLLEIGCGIGALHLELLKEGAQRAVGIDVSPVYIEAASSLAERLGFQDAVEYHVGDFVERERNIPTADIVLLHRVICCYPDMRGLVSTSARHAQRLYALTYPRRTWWMRAASSMMNLGLALFRKPFRVFIHHPDEVAATVASAGLTRIFLATSSIWQLAVYRRQ